MSICQQGPGGRYVPQLELIGSPLVPTLYSPIPGRTLVTQRTKSQLCVQNLGWFPLPSSCSPVPTICLPSLCPPAHSSNPLFCLLELLFYRLLLSWLSHFHILPDSIGTHFLQEAFPEFLGCRGVLSQCLTVSPTETFLVPDHTVTKRPIYKSEVPKLHHLDRHNLDR